MASLMLVATDESMCMLNDLIFFQRTRYLGLSHFFGIHIIWLCDIFVLYFSSCYMWIMYIVAIMNVYFMCIVNFDGVSMNQRR